MRVLPFFFRCVPLCVAVAAWAQETGAAGPAGLGPLNPPAPLSTAVATAPSPGALNATLTAAKRAQELGLPSLAVPLYRQLLQVAVAGEREELTLALTTALLDAGDAVEAQKALATLAAPHGAAWHLRAGLAALQSRKRDAAQAEWNVIKAEEITPGDRPWYYFLTGALYDTAAVREMQHANEFYLKAEAAATTELSRVRFKMTEERVRLKMLGVPSPEALEQTRRNFEQYQGSATGYDFARNYAVELAMLNRDGEAVEFLQRRVLLTLPPQERARRDEFNFLIGMVGDATRMGPARIALNQLLETGADPERQRQALQLLATASDKEPGRGQFRVELAKLIDAKPVHPIRESLLFYRAQLSLAEKNYVQAEDDANALLQSFPGSPLRLHAFGLLTASAWEQGRFRLAANHARQARAGLATTADPALLETRAGLGLLEAEAWFRAGDADDYRNAADAYAAVLRERPAGVAPGDLMYQRVLAEIKSGSPNAAKVLDAVEADPAFEAENRWRAEWNLARELQLHGKDGVTEAYARVNRLLADNAAGAPAIAPEVRARLAWLQARLSFEAGEYERTLTLTDNLLKLEGPFTPGLKSEIASTAALLKGQAQVELHDEAHGLETWKKLRADFPKSDAAISSYFFEAQYYVLPPRDRIVDAQKLLTKLADDFSDNLYAPYALYQAAVLAERLGQDDSYREANRLIVDLVKKYPTSDLVFPALLKEGDLLEKLNDLPSAQRIYQELENKFPRHREVVRAQLALARCLNAQSSSNPSYLATAQAKFEQLRNRVDVPPGVRVEAGFNLGALFVRQENPDKAIEVWWRDVVQPFLLDDKAVATKLLDEKSLDEKSDPIYRGRYWMARTLVSLGELLERQAKYDEAKRAWLLILESRLGYESLARASLARLGAPEVKP